MRRKFRTMKEAVEAALVDVGDKTSGEELRLEALKHYHNQDNWPLTLGSCYTIRYKWRLEKGLSSNDCRTYDTQDRRNMLPDDRFSTKGWKLLAKVIEASGFITVQGLLAEFHSIDQLANLVSDLKQLKAAA